MFKQIKKYLEVRKLKVELRQYVKNNDYSGIAATYQKLEKLL